MPCGIDFNISNLKSMMSGKIGGLISLSGIVGTPAGLIAKVSQVQDAIASGQAA